jgi:hypothetical protein
MVFGTALSPQPLWFSSGAVWPWSLFDNLGTRIRNIEHGFLYPRGAASEQVRSQKGKLVG